jgi:hypothetical protein
MPRSSLLRLDITSAVEFLQVRHDALQSHSFVTRDNAIELASRGKRPVTEGAFIHWVNWPTRKADLPSGFVVLSHADWENSPYVILVTALATKESELIWRFLCPVSRRLVQVVFLDQKNGRFVAREAIGRKLRQSNFSGLVSKFQRTMEMEHKCKITEEGKPKGMSQIAYEFYVELNESLELDLYLAANGLSAPKYYSDGAFNVVAMATTKTTQGASSIYSRDKPGTLRLNARSKKRLGIY